MLGQYPAILTSRLVNNIFIAHTYLSLGVLWFLGCRVAIKALQFRIDLVTVFDAILTSRQTREKLQCLYENLMPNNFRRTAVLKKI